MIPEFDFQKLSKKLSDEETFFHFYSYGKSPNSILFTSLKEIHYFRTSEELETYNSSIESWVENGYFPCNIYFYEAGFKNNFLPQAGSSLLGIGAVFRSMIEFDFLGEIPEYQNPVENLNISIDKSTYIESVETIRKSIENGEVYQVNFSFRLNFELQTNPYAFFFQLSRKKPTGYSVFARISPELYYLSLSPELFFEKKGNLLSCLPMKGTSSLENSEILNSEKNIAENYMILDLLRNDLGKISIPGSVHVSDILKQERFGNIIQVTSRVKSESTPGINFSDIFQALFPSGSITGAPKKKAMEIISRLESENRNIYTGSIGYHTKEITKYNVAIRTIEIQKNQAEMGIGSGIVFDSNPEEEWVECHQKASFLYRSMGFFLFETILIKRNKIYLWKEHLERIVSACDLLFSFSPETELQKKINELKIPDSGKYRLKISVHPDGKIDFHLESFQSLKTKGKICISEDTMNSGNFLLNFKTSVRDIYDKNFTKAKEKDYLDAIFINERSELTEGCISNLFIRLDGIYFTPPIESGLLPGVFRNKLLKRFPKYFQEKILYKSDLDRAETLFICNSLRGIIKIIQPNCI
ncbi:MAG: chorismate-binding protein [Leptospiraceae bacterium]|nr:bifunctional anthranilate synthase component I family protein/aminotransferase class IV [Leptospiraceae bacterium]MCP5511230.1 chorismate-binding protein [Leptospiraceae bacterium]